MAAKSTKSKKKSTKPKKKRTAKQKAAARKRVKRKIKRKVRKATRRASQATRGLDKGFTSSRGLEGSIKSIGTSIKNVYEYRIDTPRRELAQEINRTKAQIRARGRAYAKLAENEKNEELKKQLLETAAYAQGVADAIYTPKKLELENLSAYAKAAVEASQLATPEVLAGRSAAIVRFQMNMAADKKRTQLFGPGKVGRAKMIAFFNYYKQDYQASPGVDRLAAIIAANPGKTLQQLLSEALGSAGTKGKPSFQEYVAIYLGIDYTEVDKTDSAWLGHMDQVFAGLDSPIQDDITQSYRANYGYH